MYKTKDSIKSEFVYLFEDSLISAVRAVRISEAVRIIEDGFDINGIDNDVIYNNIIYDTYNVYNIFLVI
jgi:hypothetical protein